MAKNYVEDGNTMDWTNDTGENVASGALIVVGDLCGIAASDIADDADGVLLMTGVFSVPKDNTKALSQGDKVYVASGKVTPDAGVDPAFNPVAGTAWKNAAIADTVGWVRLGF